jgi:hypothetical protein
MAMLAEVRRLAHSCDRLPLGTELRPHCIGSQSALHRIGHSGLLALVEPTPAAEQGDHVSGEAMHWPEVALARTVKVLGPQGTEIGILELFEKPRNLCHE